MTIKQTASADEDHVMYSKAIEKDSKCILNLSKYYFEDQE